EHELAAELERFAAPESDAGARILRITDESVAGALDAGLPGNEIVAFLLKYSTVGVPPNVERTITDAVARHGRLRSGAAATWLQSDDAALIARAVAVKPAQLTVLTPHVAVSPLPEVKVLDALAAKQVAVRSEAARDAAAP